MQVLYVEDLAKHGDPESCVGIRKDGGEALAGEHAGRVLSREKFTVQGADAVEKSGRQHGLGVMASPSAALRGPRPLARAEAPCKGTGRSSGRPVGKVRPGRSASARSHPSSDDVRPGEVGLAHSTGEVAEQRRPDGRGGDGGKGRGQGQCGPGQHVPDAELGKRIPRTGPLTGIGKTGQAHPVHRTPSPCQRRAAPLVVLPVETASGGRHRRCHLGPVRNGPGGQPRGPARTRTTGCLSGEAVAASVHPDKTRIIQFGRYAIRDRGFKGLASQTRSPSSASPISAGETGMGTSSFCGIPSATASGRSSGRSSRRYGG